MAIVPNIFDAIRKQGKSLDDYPKTLGKGKFKIVGIRDLTVGFDSMQKNNKPILPVSLSNQMITFYTDDFILTLRGSGTEPKLKIYLEKVYPGNVLISGKFKNEEALIEDMRNDAILIGDELVKPESNGLTRNF